MNKTLIAGAAILVLHCSIARSQKISGFFEKNIEKELYTESQFDKNLSKENIGETIKKLSEKPHHISSPGDKENAEYILSLYKQWGWDAKIETFYVLFPTPVTRTLEITSPKSYKAVLKEPALNEDGTSAQSGQLPTYNAYSADGDVSGELVFVNYGLPEDYVVLDKMGIDVKGKIVIAKYGRSWRGIKPKVAQEHGAIGCIIYSDPADDGYFHGDVYPKGAFRNEFGVQRGSVMDMPYYPGDPLTPGVGATKDAKRLDRLQAVSLLKIPVLPISYHDATPLLESLDGPLAPDSWHGGLPFAYHIGGGLTKVHLNLKFSWDIVPCYDVIAMIKGSEFPNEWVIRGNHHDAWVNGAGDPVSGQAALLEEARSIGNLVKTGWKPLRTIVYCAWDGEEPGLLGSTEWVEEHEKELKENGVVYINSDANGRGFLFAEGSASLEPFMTEIAKQVIDPQTNVSVFERNRAHETITAKGEEAKKLAWNENDIKLDALGSGSDYSSFIQHEGVPSLNLGYGGEDPGGEYHSIYDSWDLYRKFKDTSFQYGVALAETAGHAVLRMADADELPFDFTHLYKAIETYTGELISMMRTNREGRTLENIIIREGGYAEGEDPSKKLKAPALKPEIPYIDFSMIQNALQELKTSTSRLNDTRQKMMTSNEIKNSFNKSLYNAERQLLNETGLPRREWYKHTIYAPGFYTGYGVKTLPGIREAIEQENWPEAQQQIEVVAKAILKLTEYFNELTGPNL